MTRTVRHAALALIAVLLGITAVRSWSAQEATTTRVSVTSDGSQVETWSSHPFLSADGRFVVFYSNDSGLVPGDTNGCDFCGDTFVHDLQTGTTERVSVSSGGAEAADYNCYPRAVSADGRFVVFESSASNLVPGDTNGWSDVFVHDRETGVTERVSQATDGSQLDALCGLGAISADGRYVAFRADGDLAPEDTNGKNDIYVRDRVSGTTEVASLADDDSQSNENSTNPAISADGRLVFFTSGATNLVPDGVVKSWDLYVRDRHRGTTERLLPPFPPGDPHVIVLSGSVNVTPDGRYVAFQYPADWPDTGDVNGHGDGYLLDRETGKVELVTLAADGSQGNDWSGLPYISEDARYCAFTSGATNLVQGDTNERLDVFVRDRKLATTVRVSVAGDGSESRFPGPDPFDSMEIGISADGLTIVFESAAVNLVPDDTNDQQDIFVRRMAGGAATAGLAGVWHVAAKKPAKGAWILTVGADGSVEGRGADAARGFFDLGGKLLLDGKTVSGTVDLLDPDSGAVRASFTLSKSKAKLDRKSGAPLNLKLGSAPGDAGTLKATAGPFDAGGERFAGEFGSEKNLLVVGKTKTPIGPVSFAPHEGEPGQVAATGACEGLLCLDPKGNAFGTVAVGEEEHLVSGRLKPGSSKVKLRSVKGAAVKVMLSLRR